MVLQKAFGALPFWSWLATCFSLDITLYFECLQAVWSMMNGIITGRLGNWNLLLLWSPQRTLLLSFILRAREGNSPFVLIENLHIMILISCKSSCLPGLDGRSLTRRTCTTHGDHHNRPIICFVQMGTSLHQHPWHFWLMIFWPSACTIMRLFECEYFCPICGSNM